MQVPSTDEPPALGPGLLAGSPAQSGQTLQEGHRPSSRGSRERSADRSLSRNKNPSILLSTFPDKMHDYSSLRQEGYTIEFPPLDPHNEGKNRFCWESVCRMNCMKTCLPFSNINSFALLYCVPLVCKGILISLVDVTVGIFYQEDSISVYTASIISICSDLSSLLAYPFMFYFLEKENISRLIAGASFLVGLASLFCGIPYFEIGSNLLYKEYEDTCIEKEIHDSSSKSSTNLKANYVISLILGNILHGVSSIFFYDFGEVLLNNSVNMHSAGVYLGLVESSVFFGYAMGFAVSAHLVNPPKDASLNSEESDLPHFWQQTWWRYFLCLSIISWSTIILLLCYQPKRQGKSKTKSWKNRHSLSENKSTEKNLESNIKDLFTSTLDLIKNRIFILLSLGKAMEYLHTIGASGFVPTFIEHQFLLSKKTATFISGIIIIPASAIGYILGGLIASSLKLSSRGLMRLIMISSAVSFILFAVIMFLNCDPIPFAGLNEDYDGTGLFFNLTAPCNSHCHCPTSFYSPICGRNGVSYFSSCFAGCMRSKITNKMKTYYNCSCINVGLVTVDKDNEFIDAIDGQCDSKCDKLHFSIAIFFSVIVFSGLSGIPGELLILRIVPEEKQLLTFGLSLEVARLFGTIPGTIIIKSVAELSCIFRNVETSETAGNCWLYNTRDMSHQLLTLCCFCKILTFFFTLSSNYWYKPLPQDHNKNSTPKKPQKTKRKNK